MIPILLNVRSYSKEALWSINERVYKASTLLLNTSFTDICIISLTMPEKSSYPFMFWTSSLINSFITWLLWCDSNILDMSQQESNLICFPLPFKILLTWFTIPHYKNLPKKFSYYAMILPMIFKTGEAIVKSSGSLLTSKLIRNFIISRFLLNPK